MQLPPDDTVHVRYDPRKPFIVTRKDKIFTETTKIAPEKRIIRKPDGTIGSLAKDRLLKMNNQEGEEYFIYEYADPDRHILSLVTLLIVEPVYETPSTYHVPLRSFTKGSIMIETPQDIDIFTIRCSHTSSMPQALCILVDSIVPDSNLNKPDEVIRFWKVPFKLSHIGNKTKFTGPITVNLAFINATPVQREM